MTLIQFRSPLVNGLAKPGNPGEFKQYLFSPDLLSGRTLNIPAVNITETKTGYRIEMTMPGVQKTEINVSIDNGILKVSSNKQKKEKGDEIYHKTGFNYRQFEKSFYIPDDVATEKIQASYENGILTLFLHKQENKIDKGPANIKID